MSVKPISVSSVISSAANIKGSAGYLIWIQVSNSTGNGKYCTIDNATTGTSAVLRVAVAGDDSKFLHFGADFHFATGIRVGYIETGLYVTAGYR